MGNVGSISFCDERVRLDTLPALFRVARNCEYMSIVAASLGTAKAPVTLPGGSMRVDVTSRIGGLHMRMPSNVRWSGMNLVACEELDIRHASAWLRCFKVLNKAPAQLGALLLHCLEALRCVRSSALQQVFACGSANKPISARLHEQLVLTLLLFIRPDLSHAASLDMQRVAHTCVSASLPCEYSLPAGCTKALHGTFCSAV